MDNIITNADGVKVKVRVYMILAMKWLIDIP